MKQINWSAMIAKGATKIGTLLPVAVLVDGESKFVICNKDDVIVLTDLHIRVRNMLRALEKRARAGMPKDTKIS